MLKRLTLLISMFALIVSSSREAAALTMVIDIKSLAQGNTTAITNHTVGAFDVTDFGFSTPQLATVENSILNEVRNVYYNIPTTATLTGSPIPAGFQLNINFVLGDIGSLPSNGDAEFYYAQVGAAVTSTSSLGVARTSAVRTSSGLDGSAANAATVCSIFSDNINFLGGLTPSNALFSGNLSFTTYALSGTIAHEIGHTLSLSHINKAGSVTPNGLPPIMGTGAIDLPNQDRIFAREFSLTGFDGENNNAPRSHIAQLVSAVGLRAVPEPGSVMSVLVLAFCLTRRSTPRHARVEPVVAQ